MTHQLIELVANLPYLAKTPSDLADVSVTGIALDSRQVKPGNIFVALAGGNYDGHLFIPKAIERGAAAVVGTEKPVLPASVPYFQVMDSRMALAQLSAAYYDFPARKLKVIGVTGTDGKTTTVNLIYSILQAAGIKVGMVCTIDAIIGEESIDTGFHVTTPEAPMVQELLARMVEKGMTHVVLEATSHGLAQKRVAYCEFDAAVITNITHEHLDYHGSYENYFASKAELIRELVRTVEKPDGNLRVLVFNKDDISFERIQQLLLENSLTNVKNITYSIESQADIFSSNIRTTQNGLTFDLIYAGGEVKIVSPLVGNYNVSNILAAFSVTVQGLGVNSEKAVQGIATMVGVEGRMQRISLGQDFQAIVDFAHTPNALKVALQTTRQMTQGRVIVVFGAAGLRDRAKRRMMAEVSNELADFSIFTAEDPRTEKLEDILAEMANSARIKGGEEGKTFVCIPDRGEAIRQAVKMARSGDLVMACGKGHEQSMCFGEVEYPWDDRTAMKVALADRLGIKGEKMPYLPTQD